MSIEQQNQTQFNEEGPHLDAPILTPQVVATQAAGKKPLVLLSIFLVLLMIAGVMVAVYFQSAKQDQVTATPLPQATEVPVETSQIKLEIAPYFQIISNSKLEGNEHSFPPVNFDVRIKDPAKK